METASQTLDRLPLTVAQERHGFYRTVCDCEICRVPCRHMPGSLDVADLPLLCPPGEDLFTWAERHLRALLDKSAPTLVPARLANGHCHWLSDGRCTVHAQAPYGCAFFDAHMPRAEVERRSAATLRARKLDAEQSGLYYQVWLHLCNKGLVADPGDREAIASERRRMRRASSDHPSRPQGGRSSLER